MRVLPAPASDFFLVPSDGRAATSAMIAQDALRRRCQHHQAATILPARLLAFLLAFLPISAMRPAFGATAMLTKAKRRGRLVSRRSVDGFSRLRYLFVFLRSHEAIMR
jgi:hypothetical protein